ncbi:hypothetical protein SISNIDRAFT_455897 [Sistotremastrum niveocremeum HHB9708]|uniref:FAD-binding domain-containing protein n=1 Tax=Sistotremastrum niveocremeum HHB9708 TaxID=1314777 RepID=A0A164T7E6_9AGAM|nr:hypothetical protein SISNIDRAFT_455897 [Sistotremastrum niveocremeum HHB9708]
MANVRPVLIVGSGPAGLVAAIVLRLNSIPVRLIDRSTEYLTGSRGTGLQPRTLELLEGLGIPPNKILESSRAISDMRAYGGPDGKTVVKQFRMAESGNYNDSVPWKTPRSIAQSVTQTLLRDRLEELGTLPESGTELVTFVQKDGFVEATLRRVGADESDVEILEAQYLIGADGAKGPTRKTLGLAFVGETKESDRLLIADVETDDITPDYWHMWGSIQSQGVGLKPLGGNKFQMQVIGPDMKHWHEEGRTLKDIQNIFWEISKRTDIVFRKCTWITEWRANIRLAEHFRVGNCFLVGDAGHSHSPTGGQGLNTSVQDALNLSWKIALVYKGISAPTVLDSYESERLPVIAEMLNLSTAIHTRAFQKSQAGDQSASLDEKAVAAASAAAAESYQKVMHRPATLHQLGINYRASRIIYDERSPADRTVEAGNPYSASPDGIHAGDRAPDAIHLLRIGDSEHQRLFSIFGPEHHTALVFSPSSEAAKGLVEHLSTKFQPHIPLKTVVVLPASSVSTTVDGGALPSDVTVLQDTDGSAFKEYGVTASEDVTVVIVRPDGVVGGYISSIDGVDEYFRRLEVAF